MSVVQNPILNSDFPDPDIIRVGHTYYMASTTRRRGWMDGPAAHAAGGRTVRRQALARASMM